MWALRLVVLEYVLEYVLELMLHSGNGESIAENRAHVRNSVPPGMKRLLLNRVNL